MTNVGLLTAAEVARRLGMSRRHVTRLANDGSLPTVMKLDGVRGAYLFDPDVVDRFIGERAS